MAPGFLDCFRMECVVHDERSEGEIFFSHIEKYCSVLSISEDVVPFFIHYLLLIVRCGNNNCKFIFIRIRLIISKLIRALKG